LKCFPEYADIPVIGIVAVDGKNCMGGPMNDLAMGIFWTQFGLDEARRGGYTRPGVVIPLGVDLGAYYPTDKYEARMKRGLPKSMDDAFIVGNVNRNQPRKRWDLTLKYFAEWMHHGSLKDAYLYLHVAPTGDTGIQVNNLASYYGIAARTLVVEPQVFYGLNEAQMRDTYNSFDVQISTTQGEGFGLTTFEGMACGVPQIVPEWSALGELCYGVSPLVPCTSTAIGPPYVNVIGGVADETMFVRTLEQVYRNRKLREDLRASGLKRVSEDRFRWENIGEACRLVFGLIARCADDEQSQRKEREDLAALEAERVAWGMGA
jgi:glycosyltransferase involved in cell wall biosynthesis